MDANELGAAALIIVVASIIVGIGASILSNLSVNQCDSSTGTWIMPGYCTATEIPCNNTVNNPVTGGLYGCCSSGLNATYDCASWLTTSTAINTSFKGMTGLTTMANWIPLIALVLVASIVIGVIVRYLGHAGGV